MTVRLKRLYEEPDNADGIRILVDRIWPHGVNRGKAMIDLWLEKIAPSTELRRWLRK
jgi:uncharacterized protein YeaO (DUF488 family)